MKHLFLPLLACLAQSVAIAEEPAQAKVTIPKRDLSFDTLAKAIEASEKGDRLVIEGIHTGNFTLNKSITLTGTKGATLDGGGKGTVLSIQANEVVIEKLAIKNSGKTSKHESIWGDAGVLVVGDKLVLRGLNVSECDWGVIFKQGKGSQISGSEIKNCLRDAILVLGGEEHTLAENKLIGNKTGIMIGESYGDKKILEHPDSAKPESIKQFEHSKVNAKQSNKITVKKNHCHANIRHGIHLSSLTSECEVLSNKVVKTGMERREDVEEAMSAYAEIASSLPVSLEEWKQHITSLSGSAIMLSCGPDKNTISENECTDNLGHGIALLVATENKIESNRLKGGRSGIHVERSNENAFFSNHISGFSQYGIALGSGKGVIVRMEPSTGNLIAGNALLQNKTNAYDATTVPVTAAEMEAFLKNSPIFKELPQAGLTPRMKKEMIKEIVGDIKPGKNRWHNGKVGNYYDDFDEEKEGFKDEDEDGIGESARAIPGGSAKDLHPLAVAPVTDAPPSE